MNPSFSSRTPLSPVHTSRPSTAFVHAGSAVQLLRSPSSALVRKARPATAITIPLSSSSSAVVHALVSAHASSPRDRAVLSAPLSAPTPLVTTPTTHTQRCAGCGAYAELCLSCVGELKRRDSAAYKRQLARSVEMLFARATARGFTTMRHVVLTWIFGTWRRETALMRRRRVLAVRRLAERRLLRAWHAWVGFLRARRVLGAMLLAQQERQLVQAKTQELASLHGELHATTAAASVQRAMQDDERQRLAAQIDTLQRSLQVRNSELVALRRDLVDARHRVEQLEAQAIDPQELARLRAEHADAKRMVLQLGAALLQSCDAPLEALATSDGRQNLNGILSKDLVALLDKPEHPSLFNPLVALGSDVGHSFDAPVDRADRILLQWTNAMVQRAPEWLLGTSAAAPRVANFATSLSDGRALTLLARTLYVGMSRQRPRRQGQGQGQAQAVTSKLEAASVLRENGEELTEIALERFTDHVRREESAPRRLELTIRTLGQALWLPVGLLDAKDVVAGDPELNFAVLSYLFCTAAPWAEEAQFALANDLKGQLASLKAKWRELGAGGSGGGGGAGGGSGGGGSTMVSASATSAMDTPPTAVVPDEEVPRLKLALAQTLEFKKKLDAEDAKTREGHSLWWRSTRVVLRKCFVSYAGLVRGKAGVLTKLEATVDANEAFARAPPRQRLADIELPFEDAAWESKLLQTYLGSVYCDLARIYRGYATRSDPSNTQMSVGELTELLTECRVLDGMYLAAGDVQGIMKKVMDTKGQQQVNPQRSLSPGEFVEALVRVARRKYSGEHHRVTLSEAFCLLVDNSLLPLAFRADADLFQQQLEDTKIRRLLLKFTDALRDLYNDYAVEGGKFLGAGASASSSTAAGGRRRPRMTAFTFSQCLLDRNVLDMTFNSENVLAVVQRVARTATKETGPVVDVGSEEITFDEFQEAMVVVACYKFPDPYSSLESRLEKFLTVYVRGGHGVVLAGGGNDTSKKRAQ